MNIPLSITACLGNALILIALRKVTSVHPPTKLLFRCLAVTDICVGLITQPRAVISFLNATLPKASWYVSNARTVTSLILCGVSILTSTAISADRLLALLLGQTYRHVVTLKLVRAVIFCCWIIFVCIILAHFVLGLRYHIMLTIALVIVFLSMIVSIFSYTKIFLKLLHHQGQVLSHSHQGNRMEEGLH